MADGAATGDQSEKPAPPAILALLISSLTSSLYGSDSTKIKCLTLLPKAVPKEEKAVPNMQSPQEVIDLWNYSGNKIILLKDKQTTAGGLSKIIHLNYRGKTDTINRRTGC